MNVFVTIGIIVAGALLSVVAGVALQEPLQRGAARVLGGIGPVRGASLRGIWRSQYRYYSGGPKEAVQIMQLRQLGPFVTGRCLAASGSHRHFIRGRLIGSVFSGEWQNVAEEARHRGFFQVVLTPDGVLMEGKWLGFDRHQHVQHGYWRWERVSRELKETDVQAQLRAARPLEPPKEPQLDRV
jgi:hypothetical protein